MKVATSASYWDIPIIRAILTSCQKIYTSQAENEQTLKDQFGEHKIIIGRAPESFPAGVNVITFGGLRKVIKEALKNGDQETGKLLTEYCGWRLEDNLWFKRGYKNPIEQEGTDLPEEVRTSMFHSF